MGGTVLTLTNITVLNNIVHYGRLGSSIIKKITFTSTKSNPSFPKKFLDLHIPHKRTSSSQSSFCMSESVISCVQVNIDLEVVKQLA